MKKLSALLRGMTSMHYSELYCLNCLHSFATENQLESHEKLCKKKDFCEIVLPTQKHSILEFNQYMKSDKMPHKIHASTESLIKKIDNCKNNPETTTKLGNYIPCQVFGHLII